eukprot:1155549-Pelagomonas_calceolata.AAC.2
MWRCVADPDLAQQHLHRGSEALNLLCCLRCKRLGTASGRWGSWGVRKAIMVPLDVGPQEGEMGLSKRAGRRDGPEGGGVGQRGNESVYINDVGLLASLPVSLCSTRC